MLRNYAGMSPEDGRIMNDIIDTYLIKNDCFSIIRYFSIKCLCSFDSMALEKFSEMSTMSPLDVVVQVKRNKLKVIEFRFTSSNERNAPLLRWILTSFLDLYLIKETVSLLSVELFCCFSRRQFWRELQAESRFEIPYFERFHKLFLHLPFHPSLKESELWGKTVWVKTFFFQDTQLLNFRLNMQTKVYKLKNCYKAETITKTRDNLALPGNIIEEEQQQQQSKKSRRSNKMWAKFEATLF